MALTGKRLALASAKASYEVAVVTLHNVLEVYARSHPDPAHASEWLESLEEHYGRRDAAYLETERQRLEVKLQAVRVEMATRRLHEARNSVKLESQRPGGRP